MAFVKIDRNRKSRSVVTDTVSMGLYLGNGKEIKTRSIVFFISPSVVAKLGWELIDHRIRVMLHEGVGSDQGFLMLMPSEEGYTASAGNKATDTTPIRFNVTVSRLHHYTLNDTEADTKPVQYIIDGTSLIIECPDWLRFNPLTAPPEPEPEPMMPVSAFPETRVSNSEPHPAMMPKRRGRPPKGGHRYS